MAHVRERLAAWCPGRDTSVDYDRMMRDLSGPPGYELNHVFLRDTVGHHMMAVMASQQLLAGDLADHPEVVPFAEQIRDNQHAEILQMSGWLDDRFGDSVLGPMGGRH